MCHNAGYQRWTVPKFNDFVEKLDWVGSSYQLPYDDSTNVLKRQQDCVDGDGHMCISGDKCACWDNGGNQSEEATSMWIGTWRTAFSVLLNRFSEQYASFSQRYMTSGKCVNEHFLITHTHAHTHMHTHTHTTENTSAYCAQGNHYLHKLHAVITIK